MLEHKKNERGNIHRGDRKKQVNIHNSLYVG